MILTSLGVKQVLSRKKRLCPKVFRGVYSVSLDDKILELRQCTPLDYLKKTLTELRDFFRGIVHTYPSSYMNNVTGRY